MGWLGLSDVMGLPEPHCMPFRAMIAFPLVVRCLTPW